MQKFQLTVCPEDKNLRLDQCLMKNLPLAISRTRITRLIKEGKITVKQKLAKPHYKVKANDLILIDIPDSPRPEVLPENIPLEIVFEDEDILLVDKPSGMVTHPAAGNLSHTLVSALLNYGAPLSTINGPLRPGIVHRLDKDASGLIVIAKNDFTHQNLAQQFQQHTIKRKYAAIVEGKVEHQQGIIDLPIARHSQSRQKMAVSFLKKSRPALTRYKVIKRYNDVSWLELTPQTGRTHQLRVHLKFLGHPILGDKKYGRASSFPRLALHATLLGFIHPRSGRYVEFQSDLPKCFLDFLKTLK